MTTWEPSTSVIFAPARLAIERMTSVPAALSTVATTAQVGSSLSKASASLAPWAVGLVRGPMILSCPMIEPASRG
jgi:hypothetical protein